MDTYGIWSIIPPLLAIGMAYVTRQVIPSLALSIFVGATILSGGNPVSGFGSMFQDHIVGSVADPWNVTILSVCLTLGGMIGIISGAGGMRAVADKLAARSKTPRGGQLTTVVLGLVIFFDDYANTLLIGSTMRPVTDRLRISREKLAYLCDSTAAPVASLSLISTWATYEMGILRGVFDTIGLDLNSYEALIRSIPYRFYSIFTLVFVFAVGWMGRDFGPMHHAEKRTRRTGKILGDGAVPLAGDAADSNDTAGHWQVALLPLLVVVTGMICGLMVTGWPAFLAAGHESLTFSAIRDIIGNADGALSMLWASAAGSLVAGMLALAYRSLSFGGVVERWLDGVRSVLVAVTVLVLAWGIGHVCRDLGTASFISSALEGRIPAAFVPLASFCLGCIIAFATGTAYGTVAILMPLAVPLVYTLSNGATNSLFFATIGAIFTGAVFGDHCSPISDTTIMSSMACASDHIDHVRTQLPYALTCAVIAVIAGFLPVSIGIHPVFSLIAGAMLAVAVVRFIGKRS